jgi:hypothetical protein
MDDLYGSTDGGQGSKCAAGLGGGFAGRGVCSCLWGRRKFRLASLEVRLFAVLTDFRCYLAFPDAKGVRSASADGFPQFPRASTDRLLDFRFIFAYACCAGKQLLKRD